MQGHSGWYVLVVPATQFAATPVTDHAFPWPARPQATIEDDPLKPDVPSRARQVYKPLTLADQLLRSRTVSPQELKGVAEKRLWARTIVSEVAIQS